ncbi:MAG: hypothetical protein C5S47_04275 [Candidatus Methanogasteraceae archaeon]|nr:MAG: hypothetical protein C5S47_04275 [ANME-2 cluster archaeon]
MGLVFDDRVEIRTPGKLPNTVTIESRRWGVHVLRNPTIYNVFLKLGFVTDAGSGISRMIRVFREATGQEPILRMGGMNSLQHSQGLLHNDLPEWGWSVSNQRERRIEMCETCGKWV